ncbi:hypothetical protein GCM10023231_30840 [Olivibacter ginsenosidimutans]|uniref:Uncharacterized protein n=1 Tax=Olivibacter ginsenosidimutans TaxID=1176537 RepID=A0ABP9BSH6_9SPHI
MVETFTSQISENSANKANLYEELSLNAEEKLFYALLQQPLDNLIREPSRQSIQTILAFSKQYKGL